MSTKASRGFGSFQSPDVEVLISLPDSQYEPPRAAAAAELDEDLKKEILDGKLLLGEGCRKLFMIDFDKWTFLNHGAFGAPLKPVYDKAQEWRDACEVQPLKFLDRCSPSGLRTGQQNACMVVMCFVVRTRHGRDWEWSRRLSSRITVPVVKGCI